MKSGKLFLDKNFAVERWNKNIYQTMSGCWKSFQQIRRYLDEY